MQYSIIISRHNQAQNKWAHRAISEQQRAQHHWRPQRSAQTAGRLTSMKLSVAAQSGQLRLQLLLVSYRPWLHSTVRSSDVGNNRTKCGKSELSTSFAWIRRSLCENLCSTWERYLCRMPPSSPAVCWLLVHLARLLHHEQWQPIHRSAVPYSGHSPWNGWAYC